MVNSRLLTLVERIRRNLYAIEAIELSGLSLLLGLIIGLIALSMYTGPSQNVGAYFWEGPRAVLIAVLFMWGAYLVYIRLARKSLQTDVLLWVVLSVITNSLTFWVWTFLDINRLIMAKLLYKGEAPVEYAWSYDSKQRRQEWEKAHKFSLEKGVKNESPDIV